MSHPLENIIKQGYLKKGNAGGNRLSGLLRKIEGQKWFVFTVRQSIPYLEYYDSETEVFTQRPSNSYCLSRCNSVTSLSRSNPPSFTISCSDRFIELIASSRAQSLDWVTDIETTLTRLGILKTEDNEHVYTVLPAVVRQPRVNQDVLAERNASASEMSTSSSDSIMPSSHQSTDQPPLVPAPHVHAPPVPERPPAFVPTLRWRPHESTPQNTADSDFEVGASASFDLENSETMHCSNDSDFVSWDVVMKVRESYLLKTGEGQAPFEDELKDDETTCVGACALEDNRERVTDTSNSVFVDDLYRKPSPKPKHNLLQSEDTLDLTILPNDYHPFSSLGSESDLSFNMEHIGKISHVEENEYSCLPLTLKPEEQNKVERDKEVEPKVKPIPRPRRAISFKSNSQEKRDLDNGVSSEVYCSGAINALFNSVEEDQRESTKDAAVLWPSPNSLELYEEESQTQCDANEAENYTKTSKSKDENGNFYDNKNSESHCVLAPPIIPPRGDSLTVWTTSPPLFPQSDLEGKNNPSVFSHPASLSSVQAFTTPSSQSSKVIPQSDFSSSYKVGASNFSPTHQTPAIPPLPVPRRKTLKAMSTQGAFHATDSNSQSAMAAPPQLPRRTLPKSISLPDTPPALPSRNSKSFVIRPKLASNSHFVESNEKAKLLEDQASVASGASLRERERKAHTLCATSSRMSDSKQSGLSRKMLLDRANSLHTVVSLKQTQAEILQTEIDKTHVSVTLTQKSGHGLALVDWNSMPCVAGWNQKDFPSLHGKLHIGDMLLSVNLVRVSSSEMAQKLLRNATESKIEVVLKRMPHAKVFAIRRSAEGQSLGLKREGGTAEILYVDPNGLAAEHGLPQYAPGTMEKSRCTWFLTEINSRPLNMFFKDNEIEHLLYAVGREISIVVQPSDFIFELRKGLKKIKNYKSFITQ